MKHQMKYFKINTILFPTDFSETSVKALEKAVELTKKTKAKLILLHVVESTGFIAPAEIMSVSFLNEEMIKASKENLAKLARKIKEENNIHVSHVSYSGTVYENVIRAGHLYDADLIVMGTHGTSGISEWLFGSNAFSVVNNTTIPVLTINLHSHANEFKKIVFPFNENLLTLKKAEQVIELAKIFEASVLLFGYADDKANKIPDSLREKGEVLLKQFTNENIPCTLALSAGANYADEILEYAHRENADMVTVVTNSSHNVDSVFNSRTDRKVVNHSDIPVLSVPVTD